MKDTYPMIELNDYVEDATKCVFIYAPENYDEEKGYGLTILCGLSGKKSIVSNDGEPVFLRDAKTTRLAVSKMNKQIGVLTPSQEIHIRSMPLQPFE